MIAELERLSEAWTQISEILSVPHTEAEYLRISALLDVVVDEVGEHDSHDLPEVGSQGVVSEILRGRRQINVRQVRALSERFGVSPAVFIS